MFSFPALILAGVPPITANATNNTAMWVGTVASANAYREERRPYLRRMPPSLVVSLVGSLGGAILLLHTPPSFFEQLVPWLLLFAMVVFIASPWLKRDAHVTGDHVHDPWQLGLQFLVAIYGGYFGAGIGYLMLALLAFSGLPNMHVMNSIKNLMAVCINGVAIIPFAFAHIIDWKLAIIMAIAAMLGGHWGSQLGRRLPSRIVRGFVIVAGVTMTAWFFYRTFMSS
jgi:uncharacterized membrane protein YfcA